MRESATLVGRAPEVASLQGEWQRAAAGELRCVFLTGDAGIGKTSLAEDVAHRHAATATTLTARARPLGGVASFGLWSEALDPHLRDLEGDEIRALCGGPLDDLASLLHSVAAVRGSVKIVLPPISRDHPPCQFSSVAPSRAARAEATFLSNAVSRSAVDFASSKRYGGCPGGAISSSSASKVFLVQLGIFARCVARPPSDDDFSCGFHVNFASGTRSRVLRVLAIS